MSLLQRIKAAQLVARKERRAADAAVLTTLIGEASIIGKNDGDRESTDAEVIAVTKKFIKNIDETIRHATEHKNDDAVDKAYAERYILNQFLPKQLNEVELTDKIKFLITLLGDDCSFNVVKPKLGDVLKELKKSYEGQYDGATASRIAKELLV